MPRDGGPVVALEVLGSEGGDGLGGLVDEVEDAHVRLLCALQRLPEVSAGPPRVADHQPLRLRIVVRESRSNLALKNIR